jgi:hypothetical protein
LQTSAPPILDATTTVKSNDLRSVPQILAPAPGLWGAAFNWAALAAALQTQRGRLANAHARLSVCYRAPRLLCVAQFLTQHSLEDFARGIARQAVTQDEPVRDFESRKTGAAVRR